MLKRPAKWPDEAKLEDANAKMKEALKRFKEEADNHIQPPSTDLMKVVEEQIRAFNKFREEQKLRKEAGQPKLDYREGEDEPTLFPEMYDIKNDPGTGMTEAEQEKARKSFGSVSNQLNAAAAIVETNGDHARQSSVVAVRAGSSAHITGALDEAARAKLVADAEAVPVSATVDVFTRVRNAEDAYKMLRDFYRSKTREILTAVFVDGQGQVLGVEAFTSGMINRLSLGGMDYVHQMADKFNKYGAGGDLHRPQSPVRVTPLPRSPTCEPCSR